MTSPTLTYLLFSVKGRINRKAFWVANAISCFIIILNSLLTLLIVGLLSDEPVMPGFLEAVVFIAIVMFFISWWPQVAIKVKRYHDLGMTGWNILIEMT